MRRLSCGELPGLANRATTTRITTSRVLAAHILAAVFIQAVWFSLSSMMAVVARKRFNADDWQSVFITATVPTVMVLSIFWGEVLRRVGIRRYLLIHWATTMIPIAVASLSLNFWFLFGCHVLAAVGTAGWSPLSGDLLRKFYGESYRGRAFGLINAAIFSGMMVATFAFGRALDANQNAFRVFFPAAALLYAVGVLLLRRLVRATGDDRPDGSPPPEPLSLRSLIDPILHMRAVLREDRVFLQYEAAFMTYGVGWMICNALLPVLATDRLHMTYTEFAASTQVVYPLCMLLFTFPVGWLSDKIGPAKISCYSFALLLFYPIGLLGAETVSQVALATVVYGIAMAGVQIGWMLGPVSLAPTPDKVPQYVAIHTTLVGIRGIVAQFVGMFLYRLTGSFAVPFLVAVGAFLWAAVQMSGLRMAARERVATPPVVDVPD